MRTLWPKGEEIKVRELVDASREEPVVVLAEGERAVVVLSPAEYDRLEQQERIRREAKERLNDRLDPAESGRARLDRG